MDRFTQTMLPDGIFVTFLGEQTMNVHLQNAESSAIRDSNIYVESTSDPGIDVRPITHTVGSLSGEASRLFSWVGNFSAVTPGVHYDSFIIEMDADRTRLIKKIFITRVNFDTSTRTFSAETPEGVLSVSFNDFIRPQPDCQCNKLRPLEENDGRQYDRIRSWFANRTDFIGLARDLSLSDPARGPLCPPGYLPPKFEASISPMTPFEGEHGDLPFSDPWWKVVLVIVAVVLGIAAVIVAANEGRDASVLVTAEVGESGGSSTGLEFDCCNADASGGSGPLGFLESPDLLTGLVLGAQAAAGLAALNDDLTAFRVDR